MFSFLSRLILRLWGWKVTGQYPHQLQKVVIIVAPHTSAWDFPLGVLVNSAYRCHANYVGKHTLFKWPFGAFFRWLGGIPVNRSRSHNYVNAIVEAFAREKRMHLVIAPEGTRKKVEKFKTGFYHVARLAEAPICLCIFDWSKKEVFFDPKLYHLTGDERVDLLWIWNYFKDIPGKNPEMGVLGEMQ